MPGKTKVVALTVLYKDNDNNCTDIPRFHYNKGSKNVKFKN